MITQLSRIRFLPLLFLAFTLFFTACRKETDLPITSFANRDNIPSFEKVALLKKNFNQFKNTGNSFGNNEVKQFYASLTPLWSSTRYLPGTGDSVVCIPLFDATLLQQQNIDIYLTIKSPGNAGGDVYGLLVSNLDNTYYAGSGIEPTLDNYTGTIYQINEEGKIRNFTNFRNGRFISYLDSIETAVQQSASIPVRDEIEVECLDELFNPVRCPRWGTTFWQNLGNFFGEVWGGIVIFAGNHPAGPASNHNGWDSGVWTFGGKPIYFDPKNTGNGHGTYVDPNDPNAVPVPTYNQLKDVLDPIAFRIANRLATATCALYVFNIVHRDFWNIMSNYAMGYVDANPNFINNTQTPIQRLDLFEEKFGEMVFLKNIGHPLSVKSIETPAYVWLKNHHDIYKLLSQHFVSHNDADFSKWALEFFVQHPNTTIHQFENWFMGTPPDGPDSYFEVLDPNIIIQPQNLPSWIDFSYNFPKTISGEQVSEQIGGDLYNLVVSEEINNYCAIKLSKALNDCGIVFPGPNYKSNTGNQLTWQGNDGKYYFINSRAMNYWMQNTFGTGHSRHIRLNVKADALSSEDIINALGHKKGIYSLVSDPEWKDQLFGEAHGHLDIIENLSCSSRCYFNAPIDWIDVWILD